MNLREKLEIKKTFNTEELFYWLRKKLHFFEQYQNIFAMNHIDGSKFFDLDNNGLKQLGIQVINHRIGFIGVIGKYMR